MKISLRKIDSHNWEECIALKVEKEQEAYEPSNVYSIAQSKFYNNMEMFGIYNDDSMIGFTAYLLDEKDLNLMRFMIDKDYQGKGFGKAALKEIIELMKNNFDNEEIWLSLHPKNAVAMKLYMDAGFQITVVGLEEEDEIFMKLKVR